MATGHWQAMCQPCIRGALCSCSTRQSRRDPPGFAAAAAPAAQSCPLCPQLLLCRSAGPGVPGGGCRASRTPADACTCRGCCAKRFPASCSAVLAAAVPLPPSGRRRPPSCGRPRAGCDTQAATQGRSAEKRARLRGSLKGSPRARVLLRRWPLNPFFLLFPGKALLCRERCSGRLWQKQRNSSWFSLHSPGVHKVMCLPGRDRAGFPTTSCRKLVLGHSWEGMECSSNPCRWNKRRQASNAVVGRSQAPPCLQTEGEALSSAPAPPCPHEPGVSPPCECPRPLPAAP